MQLETAHTALAAAFHLHLQMFETALGTRVKNVANAALNFLMDVAFILSVGRGALNCPCAKEIFHQSENFTSAIRSGIPF
jgi:hypothetical protein